MKCCRRRSIETQIALCKWDPTNSAQRIAQIDGLALPLQSRVQKRQLEGYKGSLPCNPGNGHSGTIENLQDRAFLELRKSGDNNVVGMKGGARDLHWSSRTTLIVHGVLFLTMKMHLPMKLYYVQQRP